MRLASRFGRVNQIRRDRPFTREELMSHVPSVFGEGKHVSRSERYAYIPTITLLESLQREDFEPFFACQTRARPGPPGSHETHASPAPRRTHHQPAGTGNYSAQQP